MELRCLQKVHRPAGTKAETGAGPGAAPTAATKALPGQRSGKGGADGVPISINTHGHWAFKQGRDAKSEKAMAPHSSTLAWRIPGTGEPVGCRLWGRTESDTTEATWQ